MSAIKKIILKTEKTQRLDLFLREELPGKIFFDRGDNPRSKDDFFDRGDNPSNSKLRRLIISGSVSVNSRVVTRPSFELRGKSEVCVLFDSEKFFYEKKPDDIQFSVTDDTVLFEDDDLIFLNKPVFFPVEQTITGKRDNLHDALVDYLWKRNPSLRNLPYAGIMHRLDRETSGVILFTKNRPVNKIIHELFENHNQSDDLLKEYFCVVTKAPGAKREIKPGDKFSVEKYMGRISSKSQAAKWGALGKEKGGLYSRTDFEVIDEGKSGKDDVYLIKCILHTGRTHQIRVHLSEEGLPILGDELYGGKAFERICLHAARLSFKAGEKFYDVRSELPEKFKEFFKKY